MNCIIPGPNLKTFAKALNALAKIGDCVYIEAYKEKLSIISLNLKKTVCVRYNFLDTFFTAYQIKENESNSEKISCKSQIKTILPLFKGLHLDKKLDFVKVEFNQNGDTVSLVMKYKSDDIVMSHELRLMELETLSIELSPNMGPNKLIGSSSMYNELLNTFSNQDLEISLEVSPNKVIARNYCLGAPLKPNSVRSQVNLNQSEFIDFKILVETTVNFSFKPLRTAINFAEAFDMNIGLNFDRGGRPLAIVMQNPTFEASFIVATVDPLGDGTQPNNDRLDVTVDDNPFKSTFGSSDIAKVVFGRCLQATFRYDGMGEVLAPDSDPE